MVRLDMTTPCRMSRLAVGPQAAAESVNERIPADAEDREPSRRGSLKKETQS